MQSCIASYGSVAAHWECFMYFHGWCTDSEETFLPSPFYLNSPRAENPTRVNFISPICCLVWLLELLHLIGWVSKVKGSSTLFSRAIFNLCYHLKPMPFHEPLLSNILPSIHHDFIFFKHYIRKYCYSDFPSD